MAKGRFPVSKFYYGSCYFPEHWDAKFHENDLRRMAKAGFNLVRMGEGAWSYFEPKEGHFQFDVFDRVLDLCLKHKIKAVMGTPTYTGPAWIADQYPETLRWNFQRQPMGHGGRRNYNYTSSKYLQLSDSVCKALADHYKGHPAIIGWQLDNEFNCHMDVSYAPSDTLAFRVWLKARYGSLDKLNKAWGTAFWSQTYGDWDEIDLPKPVPAFPNPTQVLDESRFISDTVCAFARRQASILRKADPRWFLTHNALFANVKGPDLVKELDFFSHDQYPGFVPEPTEVSYYLAQARSLSFPYGLLEQQSGPGGQMTYLQTTPRPGQQRMYAWQSLAHGASLLSYFLWRTVPFGSEQHWHGLLDSDNRDTRRLREAVETGREIKAMPKAFWTAAPSRQVALLRDFDNEINELRVNTYTGKGRNESIRWHSACVKAHLNVDQIWEHSDWAGYTVIVAPHLKALTPAMAAKMKAYVAKGGVLFLGAQSGSKDENLHLVQKALPGLLAGLAGIEIEDWSSLKDHESREAAWDGAAFSLDSFIERLKPKGAEVLATWGGVDSLIADAPALTRHKFKKGWVYYLGGYAPEAAIQVLIAKLQSAHSLKPLAEAAEDVEVIQRKGGGKSWKILMNLGTENRQVLGLGKGKDAFSKVKIDGTVVLPAYGVTVIEESKR
ncbi:MAG: beta-galactosidase [candidate division FCPU426 bacterium]